MSTSKQVPTQCVARHHRGRGLVLLAVTVLIAALSGCVARPSETMSTSASAASTANGADAASAIGTTGDTTGLTGSCTSGSSGSVVNPASPCSTPGHSSPATTRTTTPTAAPSMTSNTSSTPSTTRLTRSTVPPITSTRPITTTTPTTSSSTRPITSTTPTIPSSTRPTTPTTPSAAGIPGTLVGVDIERIPTSRKVAVLTFDAGANADGLPSILATLASTRTPATFFLTGRWAARYPALVRKLVAGGYRIANHSQSHPMMTQLSDKAITDELISGRQNIMAAGGSDPKPLFRFPYGDRDSRTIAIVNGAGYVAVRWTVDTLGWKGTSGGVSKQQVVDRVLAAEQPGEIILMHLGSNPDDASTLDADALPAVIASLIADGYRFETLDVLL